MLNLDGYHIKRNVHTYRQGDLFLAYDVNSGSIHVLDEAAYQIMQKMEELQEMGLAVTRSSLLSLIQASFTVLGSAEDSGENPQKLGNDQGLKKARSQELEEILEELAELKQEGTLFSPEAPEMPPQYPEKPVVKAICLHVAHDCNLRCEYCFAGTGAFGGVRTLMEFETGAKAIDYVLKASGHRTHCEVDFFGGEPLLNFPVVKALVRYGREAAAKAGKSIKFTLTTNAVLLDDEVQAFLEEEDISVVLSLDGRPEVHDRMRPYADGSGSYEEVVPTIRRFVAQRPESSPYAVGTYYYVRGTYTHFNLDFDRDVLHLADLGICQISLEPVVAGPRDAYAFREGDLEEIFAAYDRLGEEILARRRQGQNFNFFHFNVALDQGPCLPKRLSGCGAGHEYVVVSPEGDLYPCHQFVGQEQYKLGSLQGSAGPKAHLGDAQVTLDAGLVQAFRSAHIYAKPACRECWARFACSGGCHAANTAFTGSLNQVYTLGCQLQQKRLEVALYLKVKELQG